MADDFDDDQNDGTDLVPRSQIRALEEKAKRAAALEAELEQTRRENAFAKALGSLEHPGLQYFQKGYDGPLDVESIREAASQAGFLRTSAQQEAPNDNQPDPQEMAAHARMAAAAEGSGSNKPIDLVEAFGPRGSKKPDEILAMARAAGRRIADDYQ